MKYRQNFSLETQIFAYMLVTFGIIIGIVFGLLIINLNLLAQQMGDSSLSILNKQIQSQISSISTYTSNQILYYSLRDYSKLLSSNQLQQFLFNHQFESETPEQCINFFITKYSGQTTFCYGLFGDLSYVNNDTFNYNQYQNLTKMMGYLQLMMDNYFDFLFGGTTKEEYFTIWPGEIFLNYDPHKRPWYVGHMENNQLTPFPLYQTYYSTPYKHAVYKSTTTSRTMSIYNEQFATIAVASLQLNYSIVFPVQLMNDLRINAYMLDSNNTLLFGAEDYDEIKDFNDTKITGFNQSDIELITESIGETNVTYECQELKTNVLCLFNKLIEQDVLIKGNYLGDKKQMLILSINPKDDIEMIKTHQNYIVSLIQNLSNQIVINSFAVFTFCVIFSLLLLYQITSKMKKIMDYTIQEVFKERICLEKSIHHKTKLPSKKYRFYTTIIRLMNAFLRVLHSFHWDAIRKHKCCHLIEKFKYPHQLKCQSRIHIHKSIKQLVNSHQELSYFQIYDRMVAPKRKSFFIEDEMKTKQIIFEEEMKRKSVIFEDEKKFERFEKYERIERTRTRSTLD